MSLLTQSLNRTTTVAVLLKPLRESLAWGLTVICDQSSDSGQQPHDPLPPPVLRQLDSRDLMQGQREITIRHGGETDRLSVTRSGKLILRK